MSFFNDNRKVGLALIIVGLISVIFPIVDICTNYSNSVLVISIGRIIFGLIILGFGFKVRMGSNDKVAILSGLVYAIASATILAAIFVAAGDYINSNSIGSAILTAIVQIIVALVLFWVAEKIGGANKNTISEIVWILLVIVLFIEAILTIISAISNISDIQLIPALSSICMIFVYVYALFASLSSEVRTSMGI